MTAYITDEDLARWKAEGRMDIIDRIKGQERCWAGDRIIYRNGNGSLDRCLFLEKEKGLAACGIHETRPRVCRDFEPGSSLLCPLYRE